jgi:hypothetical protein
METLRSHRTDASARLPPAATARRESGSSSSPRVPRSLSPRVRTRRLVSRPIRRASFSFDGKPRARRSTGSPRSAGPLSACWPTRSRPTCPPTARVSPSFESAPRTPRGRFISGSRERTEATSASWTPPLSFRCALPVGLLTGPGSRRRAARSTSGPRGRSSSSIR